MRGCFAVDSTCMFAVVAVWHERHMDARAELARRLNDGWEMVVPAHALAETYSSLTRLPAGLRVPPAQAWSNIRRNFVEGRRIAHLDVDGYREALEAFPGRRISGGRVYDALIAVAAQGAGAELIITTNLRHFAGLVPGLAAIEPVRS